MSGAFYVCKRNLGCIIIVKFINKTMSVYCIQVINDFAVSESKKALLYNLKVVQIPAIYIIFLCKMRIADFKHIMYNTNIRVV